MGVFNAAGTRLVKTGVTTSAVSDPEVIVTQDLYITRQYDPGDGKPEGSIRKLFARAGAVMRQSKIDALFPAATIASISPSGGTTAGGTVVTITGTALDGATGVTFNSVAGTAFKVDSATKIHVTTPAVAAGARDVVVTTDAGTVTKTGGFTYS